MTSMSYALLATTYDEMKRDMTQEMFPYFSESGWIIFFYPSLLLAFPLNDGNILMGEKKWHYPQIISAMQFQIQVDSFY